MRVLHTVDCFVALTENWIYPQVTRVPGVEGCVICAATENLEAFPIDRQSLAVYPPPWRSAFGVPRLFSAVARRLERGDAVLALKARMWRPLILHAHFGMRGWGSLILKRQLKIPLITSFYGWDAWLMPEAESVWRERYKELFTLGALFLVEGPAMRERLVRLGCPANKVLIHRIGVDLSQLPFNLKEFAGELKIAMVGRFIEKKGLVDGLRACARASSLGVNLSVTIIGDPLSNISGERIKEELRALAEERELAGRVQFTGFLPLDEMRSLLATHHVLLCPSKQAANGDAEGGAPVVLTEAMALGLLCIGTRHCDIPELIIDGKTGYLCEEGDTSALADILCSVSRESSDKLKRLTAAGRKHIEENFSLSTQLGKVHSIYSSLLNGTNGYHKN